VCKYYRTFSSMQECREADRANDAYTQKNDIWVSEGISIPIFNRR